MAEGTARTAPSITLARLPRRQSGRYPAVGFHLHLASMNMFASSWRPAPLLLVAFAFVASADVLALSRRDQANIDTLNQNMASAEARYRQALVKIANNDPDGQKLSDAALEDMEDSVAGCGKLKGCQVSTLLATYKRLLKLGADSEAPADDEADIDPNDPDPDHAGDLAFNTAVPQAAQAASLLDGGTHRFDAMVQYNPAVQAGI